MFLRTLAISLIPALCLTGGCSRTSPFRAVERSIREKLPQWIGPADGYDVTVSRSSGSLIAGRIPWVAIHGRNVRAIEGLTLDDLQVRLEEVRFSRATRTVQEIGQTRFVARLSTASIVDFLQRRSPNLGEVQVAISGGAVRVRASPSLLGIGVPLEVDGHPVLRGESAIDFAVSRAAVLRLGLPSFAVRRLEDRINPLVDLAHMPFPLHLTAVRVEGDQAVITGTASLDPTKLKR